MSDTTGHMYGDDPMWVCDNCEGTWTGTWDQVYKRGWRKHEKTKPGGATIFTFIMCDDCERQFDERRKSKKAA